MENTITIYNKDQVLALGVTQSAYDAVSVNRKSTFINMYDSDGEFAFSENILNIKGGQDYLFLAEVLRSAENMNLIAANSLVTYKGFTFRLAATPTSELDSPLKRNLAKKEDFQKKVPEAPQQTQQVQQTQTAIQQPRF